jgi:peptide-methionine (S)-S-oxide reductase
VRGGDGERVARTFAEHGSLVVGRDFDCGVRIPDGPAVSRRRFILEVRPPQARLRDFGGLNGTFVNDRQVGRRDVEESLGLARSRRGCVYVGMMTTTLIGALLLGGAAQDGGKAVKTETATFGGGCFWCVEAVFEDVEGVISAESGYEGGHVEKPTYEQVCEKNTGHVEVCRIVFDPAKVSYEKLLQVFFQTHDPTTRDRQGNDVGPQYRSVVFTFSDAQKESAEKVKKALDASGAFPRPIVTDILPTKKFWPAEDYHQDYYKKNPKQGYCRFVIAPKMEKFKKAFEDILKKK